MHNAGVTVATAARTTGRALLRSGIGARLGVVALMLNAMLVIGLGPHAAPPAAASACAISSPSADFAARVSYSAGHARMWRLYQAYFLRQPDEGGFTYWASVRADGATLGAIAFEFASSPEFQARYGNLSHAEYVDLVYNNVLCREPDAEGRAYWAGLLETGALTRWDMMVNFVELNEYLTRTGTCHSIYPTESAAVSTCAESQLTALSSANIATHGYQAFDRTIPGGSFRGVEVDLSRPVFETGTDRCSVASINANWLLSSQKDRANPPVLGIGVVDGRPASGSSDRTDRGVIGLRFDSTPSNVVEVWPGDTLSDDDIRLNSVAYHQGNTVIESWHASAETSPYLQHLASDQIVPAKDWVWAAAGVPLIIDGQLDPHFSSAYANDPYTYQTLNHSFVAIDQNTGRLVFGATSNANAQELVNWFTGAGYEDLVMFDGGASTEYNIGGQAVVAGTSRDIPVWLGIGC